MAIVYLYVFPYFPALNNPNENVRVYMTAALVEDGTYDIGGPRARWGWVNDAACVDRLVDGTLAPCDGRAPEGAERAYYSVKAPGASFLGVPGYAVYRAWLAAFPSPSGSAGHGRTGQGGSDEQGGSAEQGGAHGDGSGATIAEPELRWAVYSMRLSGTILPTLLFLLGLHRFLAWHTRRRFLRELTFFSVALGSVMLGYAYLFASHTQSAACAFGAFMILYGARERRRSHVTQSGRASLSWDAATGAGMLAAGASLFEYPCFVLSALLSVYALVAIRPWPRVVGFGLGALVPTLVMMHFQFSAFGNPLSPGHLFVENPAFRAGHQEGFFGAESFHWDGAFALLFDGRLGMFGTSPLLALGLVGLVLVLVAPGATGRRVDALFATLCCVGLYVFICFMNIWHAGWSIGPRYLVALIPFLAFYGMLALDRLAGRLPGLAATLGLGLLAAGFVSAALPSMYYPHLMPEISAPVSQLMPVLIGHDYAPYNAGNLVHWYGSASMVPLLLVFLAALSRSAPSPRELASQGARALVLAGAGLLACVVVAQHFVWEPERTAEVRRAVAFVCEHWAPEGHDRATQLSHSRRVDEVALRVELLRDEGRDEAAADAQRRLDSLRAAEEARELTRGQP
ncbi:MAG: hypothetical protein KC593_24045 [Myxococcales bacterium]|nr:hypothetical protein [Myxococcales bacterium]MCB9626121.1 hypothetical protein [Sandaracinaceae bacterium]